MIDKAAMWMVVLSWCAGWCCGHYIGWRARARLAEHEAAALAEWGKLVAMLCVCECCGADGDVKLCTTSRLALCEQCRDECRREKR